MISREGADLHIGFNLHSTLTQAGLSVESVRAECLVQTPSAPYGLANIVKACLPRVIALGVATAVYKKTTSAGGFFMSGIHSPR